MTLVEKAHGDRNFRQREIRLNQHLLGALDSLLYEVDMRGHPDGLLKLSRKMMPTQPESTDRYSRPNALPLIPAPDASRGATIRRVLAVLAAASKYQSSPGAGVCAGCGFKSDAPDCPTCLVLDIRLPGQSGLDFQRELAAANWEIPIIFVTGHGDIPMSVQAMKWGAIEFLTKPFRDQDLLDAIQLGLARDRARRENDKDLVSLRQRFASLSPREREIVIQVARGRLSKQIAHDIGIAEATVKVHRSRAMQKMQVGSFQNSAGWLTSSS
jgi:FixJ family two-component response regulator